MWLNQGVGDVKLFLTILRQRLKDQFIQGWAGEIPNSSKLTFLAHLSQRLIR